jgi:hypothetical protein
MADILGIGTIFKEDFTLLDGIVTSRSSANTPAIEPIDYSIGCCFELPALAEQSFTDELKNDSYGFITFWEKPVTSVAITLEKNTTGVWSTQATLTGNSLGTYYALGFYTSKYNVKPIGYKIEWQYVLAAYGEGNYRLKASGSLWGIVRDEYSPEFCLKTYTTNRADNTVRIEWWHNGNIGDKDFDENKRDFAQSNWYSQLRLPNSKFGFNSSDTVREYIKYQSGQKIWTKSETVPKYKLKTGFFNAELHNVIQFDVLQGDKIRITDYNKTNQNVHKNRYVIPDDNYKLDWVDGSNTIDVEIMFQPAIQNHVHRRE